jgi:hypothetical protein
MGKHWLTSHEKEETCPEFRFKIVGNFKDALSRQVTEAVMIHYSQDILLNSKNEYNDGRPKRLIEVGYPHLKSGGRGTYRQYIFNCKEIKIYRRFII